MSAVKALTAAGIGAGAIYLAGGICAYEALLRISLSDKISEKLNLSETLAPTSEEPEMTPEEKKREDEKKAYSDAWNSWYAGVRHQDIFIKGRSGEKRHALIFMNEKPTDKWAVILHGYTSEPDGMAEFAYCYNKMGFNCILPSMIGHYKDPQKHASMGWKDRFMVTDFIDYILLQDKDAQIVIHGVSMGGATTMMTTGEKLPANVRAAVADCGYTSVYDQYEFIMKDRGLYYLQPLLGVTSFVSQLDGNLSFRKCSPEEAVRHSVTPTLFVHGEADRFVPFYMQQQVYDACSAEKEKFSVKEAAHAESSWQDPVLYWNRVLAFLRKHMDL